jgi:hypothetical protein
MDRRNLDGASFQTFRRLALRVSMFYPRAFPRYSR